MSVNVNVNNVNVNVTVNVQRSRQRPIDFSSVGHRRRRHLHRQRHGGIRNMGKNPNYGENDINGKNYKICMDGRNGTNECRFLELPKSLCQFICQSVIFLLDITRTDTSECRARDGR